MASRTVTAWVEIHIEGVTLALDAELLAEVTPDGLAVATLLINGEGVEILPLIETLDQSARDEIAGELLALQHDRQAAALED